MIDIEPVTLVFSFVLFGAFTVPFIYHSQQNKKKESKLLEKLLSAAKTQDGKIDLQETWRHEYAIGLDSSKKILFYHQNSLEDSPLSIDLRNIKKVSVSKKLLEFKSGSTAKSILDQVSLELLPKDSKKASIHLELYDGEKYSDLLGETLLAEKWAELIQKNLN